MLILLQLVLQNASLNNCAFSPGMKVYVTEEHELIMEPSLKWAANPNITVVVKAYGLKATIQV
jgi:hypothetical protein